MNRVYIVYRDGKVFTVRSTETLAKIAINIAKAKFPDAEFTYEERKVAR